MQFSRVWAMPSPDTFTIQPIADLLDRWLEGRSVVIDPFARNSLRGTIRNDLNPETSAHHHLPAEDFAVWCEDQKIVADAVLFDPPYSPRQIQEVYQQIGRTVGISDTQTARMGCAVKHCLASCLCVGGIAISCGWNSNGFGIGRGFEIEEVLLVAHGGAHNDTIVVVERRIQAGLFDSDSV